MNRNICILYVTCINNTRRHFFLVALGVSTYRYMSIAIDTLKKI